MFHNTRFNCNMRFEVQPSILNLSQHYNFCHRFIFKVLHVIPISDLFNTSGKCLSYTLAAENMEVYLLYLHSGNIYEVAQTVLK